jgi:hypothetical protein
MALDSWLMISLQQQFFLLDETTNQQKEQTFGDEIADCRDYIGRQQKE